MTNTVGEVAWLLALAGDKRGRTQPAPTLDESAKNTRLPVRRLGAQSSLEETGAFQFDPLTHGETSVLLPGKTHARANRGLSGASRHFANQRAAALAADNSEGAFHCPVELLASLCGASDEWVDYGVNAATFEKDDLAWSHWVRFCTTVLDTTPYRTAAMMLSDPGREADLLGMFTLWIYPQLVPRSNARRWANPRSALAHARAIIRTFGRWGVRMPTVKALLARTHGLMRAYINVYGPHALTPSRKEPWLRSMTTDVAGIPAGSTIGGREWQPTGALETSVVDLICILYYTALRFAEAAKHLSGEIRYIVRDSLVWHIAAVAASLKDPSVADLNTVRPGDSFEIIVPLSKSDQFGEIHCPFPIPIEFSRDSLSAFQRILAIELREPCHGTARESRPLIARPDGQPYTHGILDPTLHAVLVFLYGEQVARRYSWHSMRIGLACALRAAGCPPDVIMLICRWMSVKSLHSYSRKGLSEHIEWTAKALAANVDARQAATFAADPAMRFEAGDAFAHWIGEGAAMNREEELRERPTTPATRRELGRDQAAEPADILTTPAARARTPPRPGTRAPHAQARVAPVPVLPGPTTTVALTPPRPPVPPQAPLALTNPRVLAAVALGAQNPNMDGAPRAQDVFDAQASELRARLGLTTGAPLIARLHRLHLGLQFYRPPTSDGLDAAEAAEVRDCWAKTHRDGCFEFREDARRGLGVFTLLNRTLSRPTAWGREWDGNTLPLSGVCFMCDEPGAHDLNSLVHVPSTRSNLWAGSLVGPISLLNAACAKCANVAFGSHSRRGNVTCLRAVQIKPIPKGSELLTCYPLAFADAHCPMCNSSLTADVGVGSSYPSTPVELGWTRYKTFGGRCREVCLETGEVRYAEASSPTLLLPPTPLPVPAKPAPFAPPAQPPRHAETPKSEQPPPGPLPTRPGHRYLVYCYRATPVLRAAVKGRGRQSSACEDADQVEVLHFRFRKWNHYTGAQEALLENHLSYHMGQARDAFDQHLPTVVSQYDHTVDLSGVDDRTTRVWVTLNETFTKLARRLRRWMHDSVTWQERREARQDLLCCIALQVSALMNAIYNQHGDILIEPKVLQGWLEAAEQLRETRQHVKAYEDALSLLPPLDCRFPRWCPFKAACECTLEEALFEATDAAYDAFDRRRPHLLNTDNDDIDTFDLTTRTWDDLDRLFARTLLRLAQWMNHEEDDEARTEALYDLTYNITTLLEDLEADIQSAQDGFFHLEPEVMQCWLDAANHLQGWWLHIDAYKEALQDLRDDQELSPP